MIKDTIITAICTCAVSVFPIFGFLCLLWGIVAAFASLIQTATYYVIGACICVFGYYLSAKVLERGNCEDARLFGKDFGKAAFFVLGTTICILLGILVGSVALSAVLPGPDMGSLDEVYGSPLPSETHPILGGNLSITARWSEVGCFYDYDVVAEGEERYNATIFLANRTESPEQVLTNPTQYKILATLNKTASSNNTGFFWIDADRLYPLVVLDDGTSVSFLNLTPVPW